jgi:hypothetical protein
VAANFTNDEVADAWRRTIEKLDIEIDDDRTAFGLRYNGPDDEWAWTAELQRIDAEPPFAPVGLGATPVAALDALVKAVEHGIGYWPVKRPWDAKSASWAREEGFE